MKKLTFKMNTYAAMIVVGISMLALGGCEDEPVAPKMPTTSEKICANTWELASMPIDPPLDLGAGVKLKDYMQMMQDCEKDNSWTFKADDTYLLDEGLLKCSPADPQSKPGTWSLGADGKTFTLDGQKATLILIDDNNMQFRRDSFLQNSSLTMNLRKR